MISNTFNLENLKPFDLIDSSFLANKHDSIVLIQSKNNKSFGTGFVVHRDSQGSYILTSKTIIESADELKIGEFDVEIIALDLKPEIDLAIVYIKKIFGYSFVLDNTRCKSNMLVFRGYEAFTKDGFLSKTQKAILKNEAYTFEKKRLPPKVNSDFTYYKMETEENNSFQRGMMGSPIFCSETGKVIAVLSLNKGSKEGYAIPIENLAKVWKDMPINLLSKEKNKSEEIEVIAGTTTFLVYMISRNDLNSFAKKDIEILKRASSDSNMNIVVQFDQNDSLDDPSTIRICFKNGEIVKEEYLGTTNTGDPMVLQSFLQESVDLYPSAKLIVIIWSHGLGVDDSILYREGRGEDYFDSLQKEEVSLSRNDSTSELLSNLELQKALDISVDIDILGFDAGQMGMLEILYQVREQTLVMVASQHLVQGEGLDYKGIVTELDTSVSALRMGEQFVSFNDAYYINKKREVVQSALSTVEIDEVAKNLDIFAEVLRKELNKGDVEQNRKDVGSALANSQFFNRRDYVDLIDFIHKVKNRLELKVLDKHVTKLLVSLKKLVVANHTIGHFMEDANGVSLYFPNESRPFKDTFQRYGKLDFAKACPNWIKLIKWFWSIEGVEKIEEI